MKGPKTTRKGKNPAGLIVCPGQVVKRMADSIGCIRWEFSIDRQSPWVGDAYRIDPCIETSPYFLLVGPFADETALLDARELFRGMT